MRGDGDCQPATRPGELALGRGPSGPPLTLRPPHHRMCQNGAGRADRCYKRWMPCEAWCAKGPKESERDLAG